MKIILQIQKALSIDMTWHDQYDEQALRIKILHDDLH